jgi:RNA polymerase sigma-70 factor (ECF subfamily)
MLLIRKQRRPLARDLRPQKTLSCAEERIQMYAGDTLVSIKHGLVTLLPKLKRFADVLVGERREGTALLARALRRMLSQQHRYQRGTPLDRFAFAEIYRLWLEELRTHADPLLKARPDEQGFDMLFLGEEGDHVDWLTASFLGNLPPQQRATLLLVYGEGFDYDDAGRVLDALPEKIAARLIRASATLADRLSVGARKMQSASIETLYPRERAPHDRAQ